MPVKRENVLGRAIAEVLIKGVKEEKTKRQEGRKTDRQADTEIKTDRKKDKKKGQLQLLPHNCNVQNASFSIFPVEII